MGQRCVKIKFLNIDTTILGQVSVIKDYQEEAEKMDNLNSYAFYSIKGFNASITTDCTDASCEFVVDCGPIEKITLIMNNGNTPRINRAVITYKCGTVLNGDVLAVSKHLLERFLLIFIIENGVHLQDFCVSLESYTVSGENTNYTYACENICITEKLSCIISYGIENLKKSFEEAMLTQTKETLSINDDFVVLGAIFDVASIDSRYLLQYEFLKHLVAELYGKEHGSQKLVYKFVIEKYNVQALSMKKINTTKSALYSERDEDYITHYRNVIGHPAVTEKEKASFRGIDLRQTLMDYSKRMNEVILFAIREKKRLCGHKYTT